MATKITIPVLLFEAQNDTAVTSRGHKAFCRRVAKCSLVYVPAAYHELFIEKDTIRTEVLKEIVDFISSI
jgi:lysophospholipase